MSNETNNVKTILNNTAITSSTTATTSTTTTRPRNKVFIVDEMMGSGKSSAAINYINQSVNEKFIVITPYLDEVERYKLSCPLKRFKEPLKNKGKKINDVKSLLRKGSNIVCTHALFQRFDDDIITMCRSLGYTMIMDEVAEVVQEYDLTTDDINLLLNENCYIDDHGLLKWKDDCQDYKGEFEEVKNLCNLGGLSIVRGKALLWLFPIKVFDAFNKTYILTYMFNAQLQRYYYDYYGIAYSYLTVTGDSLSTYSFSEREHTISQSSDTCGLSALINIVNSEKMNVIGDGKFDLSVSWYEKYKNTAIMKQLQNNISNFFRHIRNDNSKDNIWTCFKDYKSQLSGKGYTRGFIPLNMRATNSFRDRTSAAYPVNRFLNPMIKGFFQDHGVEVDEDGYALSEMLQWIWRSAIRDGNPIWLYVPSSRMRNLLISWIDSVDNTTKSNGESVVIN